MALRGSKTTRAFRTIGEASEELGLQPHVLRFWESKFSDIQPTKSPGGRRFYRPEDIEFIRGIKKLLHDEKHPIKDVQGLIRRNGAQSIVELGRSVERAARDRDVRDVALVPERIRVADDAPAPGPASTPAPAQSPDPAPVASAPPAPSPVDTSLVPDGGQVRSGLAKSVSFEPEIDREGLEDALAKLRSLKGDWAAFRDKGRSGEG